MASSKGNGTNLRKWVITGGVLFLTVAVGACGSGSDLQEVTRKAVVGTTAAQSYRETGTTSRTSGGDTVTLYAEGEYAAPDRYRVKVRNETGSWDECIQIGDQSYVLTPNEADWPGGERRESCVVLPIAEELAVLHHLVDFEVLPDQQIGGVDCVHYRANVDVEAWTAKWEAGAEYPPPPQVVNLMKGQSMGVELWVGKDDYFVRQMKTEARLLEYDLVTGQESWVTQNTTTRFYDFNEPIAIEPPAPEPSGVGD
ncbi:MAG: hypothetical protein GTO63_17265 [Anaerolineae bacterium]|nr:hypothetical protein [Anaerolineae bacterium]NIN96542.1 hypothetical protein [Anaerolineae bacterium]NIQ79571.1 hypothetical protein [Anaerolineae bacterium]